MRWTTKNIRKTFRYCADFILPPVCIACRTATNKQNTLCPQCWTNVNFIVPPICDRLGIPLPYNVGQPHISVAAIINPPIYDRARTVAEFTGSMRTLIHGLKYADRHEGLQLFGKWLINAGKDILEEADLIVPVPLHPWRLWSRRFNQSSLLAQAVSQQSNIPIDHLILKRKRNTKAQVGQTRKQREKNVSGAFIIQKSNNSKVENKNIVLVDDVLTTGATINACTKALKKANANKVDILTLARVIQPQILEF